MKHLRLLGLPLAVAAFFLIQGHAHAATITVSGGCSIENAIASSNGDTATGGCIAGSGTDEIDIPAGTWTLAASTDITDTTIIQGAGMGQTIIDGDNAFGAFLCNASGPTLDMQVNDLTIQNVATSPAVSASSCNLDVENVEIKDSIFGSSSAVVADEWTADNFTVIANGLYIHGNDFGGGNGLAAFVGGGSTVTAHVDFTVSNYTFTANTKSSSDPMAGIGVRTGGGLNDSITASIRNSTLANVTSNTNAVGMFFLTQTGRSGAASAANVTVQNVTIARNIAVFSPPYAANGIMGVAMAVAGSTASTNFNLQNNILAGNSVNGAPSNCQVYTPGSGGTETVTFTSLGNNLADDSSCGLTGTNDQQGLTGLEATLDAMALNGATIPTIGLLAGSPAIDAGATISGLTSDQRGVGRPLGNAYDVGAFESVLTASVPSGSSSGGNNAGSAGGTLADTGSSSPAVILVISLATSGILGLALRNRRHYRISLR